MKQLYQESNFTHPNERSHEWFCGKTVIQKMAEDRQLRGFRIKYLPSLPDTMIILIKGDEIYNTDKGIVVFHEETIITYQGLIK